MATFRIVENDLLIPGNGVEVTSVCVLEGGRLAVSLDTMVHVWETHDNFKTFTFQRSLEGHTEPVSHLCMLSKGRLASASRDNTVRIWDASGECLHILEHSNVVTSICAINDTHLVSASWDNGTHKCLSLWNLKKTDKPEVQYMLEGHGNAVMSVCSLGGEQFASGSLDHTVRVWNADSGECLQVLEGHTASVMSVCVVSSVLLVSTSADGRAWVWNPSNGALQQVIDPANFGFPWRMVKVFNLFNGHLAFICNDKIVRFWELHQDGFPIATGGYRTKRRRMKKPYKKKKGKSRTLKRLT